LSSHETTPIALQDTPEWQRLVAHQEEIAPLHLRTLFEQDPERGRRLARTAQGIHLDYSKNRILPQTVDLLVRLADARGLRGRIDAMFGGEAVNVTEERAALHVALRCPAGTVMRVDGVDVVPSVQRVLGAMANFADGVRAGRWRGATGRAIRNVVNLGIGGSDLGPAMAYDALRDYAHPDLRFRFVSNVDAAHFVEATRGLDPAETLFIVCSKTFTTAETMTNAATARAWIADALGGDSAVARHFVAASTNVDAAERFGIEAPQVFPFWDWVGGRYSVTSAVGLSLMIALGRERHREFLDGFHAVDEHFRSAPFDRNLPVLMGLLGVWYDDFFGAQTHCVLPYSQRLARFPEYLQQLCMESEGKSVDVTGARVGVETGPIVWGQAGTNGQHAFYQLLHQGTKLVPCDFIGVCRSPYGLRDHDEQLAANLFAQSAALAFGREDSDLARDGVPPAQRPHRRFEGNRPSNTLLVESLDPNTLGKLIALYEHRTFVQASIWGVNPFDQWGVELGKQLATAIAPDVAAGADAAPAHDGSTNELILQYRSWSGRD